MLGKLICLLMVGSSMAAWELAWSDEFDSFDPNKWEHEVTAWGGGNQEFQVYTPSTENTFVKDGKLFIKPTLLADSTNPLTGQKFGDAFMQNGVLDLNQMYGRCTQQDNNGCRRTGAAGNMPPVMSGRIRTAGKFSFLHGKVDIYAKMPVGDWMWPALWLLPENWEYGGWPRSGEIDMTESIGNRDCTDSSGNFVGIQKMGSTEHWGPASNQNRYYLTGAHNFDINRNYGDHFHKYTLDWSPMGLRHFIDDKEILTIPNPLIPDNPSWQGFWNFGGPWNPGTENPWAGSSNMAPFDKSFHFLFNVAVGGTNGFIPDGLTNRGGSFPKPWNNGMGQNEAMRAFWDKRNDWLWTWNEEGDNSAMQVDKIEVFRWV